VNLFRTLKIALSISIIVFMVLGVSASFAILDRQKALEDAARYNMVWAVSQAIGEFYRFEGSVGAYGVPESGTDKDEVQLRFDILYNRLDIFRRGDVKEFTDAKPELEQTVEAFGRLLTEIDPLVQTIDRPGAVARILKLCQPFKAKLAQLAASANEYGGDQASADQHRLLQLHGIFSGIAAALVVCGFAFIILLFFQNRLLTTAYESLRAQIEERERAEEALRQSQKMEAIGRLTGGVAHDFNNLLTVVAGNLDLIERLAEAAGEGGVPRDRLRRLVEAAQRGLARGERLTRQLLVLSRQDPIEARIVDVNAMIADFAPLIQGAIGETIELRLQLGGGKGFCKLDPTQFEAAMLNLAINARDATDGAGTLTIATSPAGLPDDLTEPAAATHILPRSPIPGRACPPRCSGASSSRSIRQSRSAWAAVLGWRRSGPSPPSPPGGLSSTARRARAPPSGSIFRSCRKEATLLSPAARCTPKKAARRRSSWSKTKMTYARSRRQRSNGSVIGPPPLATGARPSPSLAAVAISTSSLPIM
jgi:signal transduction histidine kinase